MESSYYEEVKDDSISSGTQKSWKPFYRQLLVCTSIWTAYFIYGLIVGAPTVFIPQIRDEANSTEIITDEMASWLSSVFNFSGFPWVIVLSICTKYLGRKLPFIIAAIDTLLAFTVFFFSTSVMQILISEVMQGLFSASLILLSVMVLTEYTSPRYRGVFLTLKLATMYWGVWVSNAIGTFFHWRKVGLLGIICSGYILLTLFVWPESPYWLASKGRYKECARAHRWLKGCDEESEKELDNLIKTQKEYLRNNSTPLTTCERIKDTISFIKSKEFYKPTVLALLTACLAIASGKLIYTVYALDIIKKITKEKRTAYLGMLILDGVTVLSMYFGCAISNYFKRKSFLLVTSSIGILFLFALSLYLYLIKFSIINENKYASIILLTAFSLAISSGPLIMSTSIYGELIPLRSRNLSVCIIAIAGKLLLGTFLKIAPSLFKVFELQGAFLFFGILSLVITVLLYKYLPETKDKTLQEIADAIKGTKARSSAEAELLTKNPADEKVRK